ncbi:hypothetical protein GQ600_23088 [Phytophthora cactorum]|nr:hypothetical protein GQ600_23088 [Phytophthora cactorum]
MEKHISVPQSADSVADDKAAAEELRNVATLSQRCKRVEVALVFLDGSGALASSVSASPHLGQRAIVVLETLARSRPRSRAQQANCCRLEKLKHGIKVFAVGHTGAADAYNSFQKRELMGHTAPVDSVADGFRTKLGKESLTS